MHSNNQEDYDGHDCVLYVPISVKKYLGGVVFLLAFVLLSTIGAFSVPPQPFKWVFFSSFWALCTLGLFVMSGYLIFRDRFALRIDERGVHEQFISGTKSILWDEIISMGVSRSAQGEMVAFRCKTRTRGRMFTAGRYDVWLRNSYSIGNDRLLEVFESWHGAVQADSL